MKRKVPYHVAKFRKKPVVIQALRLHEEHQVNTLEGTMTGNRGDWLVWGVEGEQYFVKDDIFRKTYNAEGMFAFIQGQKVVDRMCKGCMTVHPNWEFKCPKCGEDTGVNAEDLDAFK